MPTITLPDIKFPEIVLGDRRRGRRDGIAAAAGRIREELPKVDVPRVRDVRRAATREFGLAPSPWPFVLGAIIVGLLVGWVLAMSPVTGPRIRGTVGRMRNGVDRWRHRPDVIEETPEPVARRADWADVTNGQVAASTPGDAREVGAVPHG